MSELEFKGAIILTSRDLGEGHFRHMAILDQSVVNIVQMPSAAADELMLTTPEAESPTIAASDRERIAASLNGKQVKSDRVMLSAQQKIAAALTAQGASKGAQ